MYLSITCESGGALVCNVRKTEQNGMDAFVHDPVSICAMSIRYSFNNHLISVFLKTVDHATGKKLEVFWRIHIWAITISTS